MTVGTTTLFGDSARELRLIAGYRSMQIKRSRDVGPVQEILSSFLFKYTDTISSTESAVQSSTQTETEMTASTNRRSSTVQLNCTAPPVSTRTRIKHHKSDIIMQWTAVQ